VLQRNIDVASLAADYSPYKLIVASNLHLIDDAIADRLRAFVAAGGILVLNARTGTQNNDNSMRLMLAPGPFLDIAGVKAEAMLDLTEYMPENGSLDKDLKAALGISLNGDEAKFTPRTIVESLVLHGAEPVATVRGGRMAGKPTVTRNRYGKGWVYYVGVDCLETEFYEAFARQVGNAGKLMPLITAPYGVEVTSRQDADSTYYFLINLTETAHGKIELPSAMDDLIGEGKGVTLIALGPLDVAVLVRSKAGTH
jgi:beta-galactosidase